MWVEAAVVADAVAVATRNDEQRRSQRLGEGLDERRREVDGVRVALVHARGVDHEARRINNKAHIVRVHAVERKLSVIPEAALDGHGPLISCDESDESLAHRRHG